MTPDDERKEDTVIVAIYPHLMKHFDRGSVWKVKTIQGKTKGIKQLVLERVP